MIEEKSKPKASSVSKDKDNNDKSGDYTIFPPLEEEVKGTIIGPCPMSSGSGEELPEEIYARIGYVHGFPRFNYLSATSLGDDQMPTRDDTSEESEANVLSLSNLLGSSSSSDDSILISSSSDLSLSDIISGDNSKTKEFLDKVDVSYNSVIDSTGHAGIQILGSISKLPAFEQFRVLHIDPLLIAIDDFFTDEECEKYISMSEPISASNDGGTVMTRSKTVGKDDNAKNQRTSTTWFHKYKHAPELMAKSARLFGFESIDQFEEPQTVRYRRSEKFTWHLDAFAPGSKNMENGGQRTATLLVYLTDLPSESGGATTFRDLGPSEGEPLRVQPKKGSALLFFPAAGGITNTPFDIRTLHAGEEVSHDAQKDKWIAQLWLREHTYAPNVPPGNSHNEAAISIEKYCNATLSLD